MAAKKKAAKGGARDLGTASGVAEARQTKDAGNGKGDKSFMHEQREQDAEEIKLGAAAKDVKQCHMLTQEANLRLSAARKATSTQSAIKHDLERVVELAGDIGGTARDALEALGR